MPNTQITTQQGPSAENQTSQDHSHDPNQKARHPQPDEELAAEGVIVTPNSVSSIEPDADQPPV